MSMTTNTTVKLRRDGRGGYVSEDGWEARPALDGNLRQVGWHLMNARGEWCQTYQQLGDVREAIADLRKPQLLENPADTLPTLSALMRETFG